jgi:drug/metabolite transporter (DMT)-like permease
MEEQGTPKGRKMFKAAKEFLQPALSRMAAHVGLVAFVLFVLGAGSTGVAIRFSNVEMPPFWGAASRFALGALTFWIIVLVRRIPLPRGRSLRGILLYGAINLGLGNALIYWALVHVEAGKASIFLASAPLATIFMAGLHGLEALTWRSAASALVAVAGIALIAGGGASTGLTIPVLLALIALPIALGEGTVILKIHSESNPVATNALALSVGTLMLAGLSLLTGEPWSLPGTAQTWAAFGYLVVIGTVLASALWLVVLARWPASRTAYAFVLVPLVSVAVSVWLTGEVITATFVLGALVTLAGVWLGALSRAAQPQHLGAPEMVPCPEGAEC